MPTGYYGTWRKQEVLIYSTKPHTHAHTHSQKTSSTLDMPTHFVTTKNIKFACGFCAPIAIILQKGVINAHKMALHVYNDTGSSCKVTDHVIQVHNVGRALVHSYPALTKCSQVSHLKSHKAKRLQAKAVAVRQTCRSVTINSN